MRRITLGCVAIILAFSVGLSTFVLSSQLQLTIRQLKEELRELRQDIASLVTTLAQQGTQRRASSCPGGRDADSERPGNQGLSIFGETFLTGNDPSRAEVEAGVYLRKDLEAKHPIDGSEVQIVKGDLPQHIDIPASLEDICGFCLTRGLSEGARLSWDNMGICPAGN